MLARQSGEVGAMRVAEERSEPAYMSRMCEALI
jgi:hypothetical protein